jgi:nicotinamide mononucleotide transporter
VDPLEIAANAITAASIWLAARNHAWTWPVGIVGCALFTALFFRTQLYADATLQLFFIATSAAGWWQWQHRAGGGGERPVSDATPAVLGWMALAALATTLAYGFVLHRFTDAYLPYVDSAVLGFSVMAQLLLMQRKLATWPVWLVVNTISVWLFASRGLSLTAVLYACYWLNAWYGWWRWRRARSTASLAAA